MRVLPLTPPSPAATLPSTPVAASGQDGGFESRVQAAVATAKAEGSRAPRRAFVPAQRTALSATQAARALQSAFERNQGVAPSEETVAILTAHWAHETGRGEAMLNYNFGGIKGRSPEGLTARYVTHEGHGATRSRQQDGFRAYSNAESGAADYIGLLQRRYPTALRAAADAQPGQFVQALHEGGYFTADPSSYTRSIRSLASTALRRGVEALSAPGNRERQQSPEVSSLPRSGSAELRTANPASPFLRRLPSVLQHSAAAQAAARPTPHWHSTGQLHRAELLEHASPESGTEGLATAPPRPTPILELWNQQLAADAVERAVAQLLARNEKL